MREKLQNIEFNKGLGQLLFGMTRDEVKELIGEPFEIEKHEGVESNDMSAEEVWHYDQLELSIGFEEMEEWTLVSISITSVDYKINEVSLIGKTIEAVTANLEKWGILDFEVSDFPEEENQKVIISDFLGAIIWFDDNIANEISWSPLYDESSFEVDA